MKTSVHITMNCRLLYKYYDLQYAYIDCGHDGIPELTLRYMYTGEMSESEGDYEFIDVIKYIDGRLQTLFKSF